MAHNLSIPVEINCETLPSTWEIGIARARKLHTEFLGRSLEVIVISPQRFRGLTRSIALKDLPPELIGLLRANGNRLSKGACAIEIEVLIGYFPSGPVFRKVDPWELRSEFLALDGSTIGLVSFLNRFGGWDRRRSPGMGSSLHENAAVVVPKGIWRDRKRIEADLMAGASKWFSDSSDRDRMRSFFTRPEFPHYYRDIAFCADTIDASITIDFLRKVSFRICERSDCGHLFPAERKGKMYCTQYCGHLVSVRKTRKEQQAVRRKGK